MSQQDPSLRVEALEKLLLEKGLIDLETVDRIVEHYETNVGPLNGARVVARAWTDPAFKESLLAANELFKMSEYVLSDELSLVDCTLGPLLWRLPHYGVKLGKPGAAVENYAHRIFSRASFKASLTQAERDLLLSA